MRAFRLAPIVLALGALAGCGSLPSKNVAEQVRSQSNPADRGQRAITHFTPALRCMDELMFAHGTRDVTLMMEELRDSTQKVHVSARDMMTSAISDMTRRSRAVRLSVFGSDQNNLAQLLQLAQKTQPLQVLPEFNIRGTISQFDEDVRRQSSSIGLLAERAFGLRLGGETRFSVLGFDAAVVRTENMTLVPGVSSKNTTVISKRDASAGDGQARILGASAVFSFGTARAEGTAQAARNMVELAAIELVGKLARLPYWQCLGVSEQHPEVQREIEDWFLAMGEGERIAFLKERLRERRRFDGPLDARRSAGFDAALGEARLALGLPERGAIDLELFRRFVTRTLSAGTLEPPVAGERAAGAATALAPALADASAAPGAPSGSFAAEASPATPAMAARPDAAAAALPPALHLFAKEGKGGQVELQALTAAAGYVYCFAQDPASGSVRRIFPNRFTRDPHLAAGATVALPGAGRFQLSAQHRHACLHTVREIYNELPPSLRWGDFDEVRLTSFEQIRQAFAQVGASPVTLAHAQAVGK